MPCLVLADTIEEQPLQLIITSYNNADWYKRNLDGVFQQKYSNYKAIYIDDCSTDNTAELVEQYIAEHNQQDKWTIIKNKTWQSQMANHYKAVEMCDDNVICLHLDGDDWFANDQVFNVINNVYTKEDVWVTCGRPIIASSGYKLPRVGQDIIDNAIKTNGFRNLAFWFTHLRTFRASLFKSIKLQDLLHRSTFTLMSPAPDLAFMFPMVEMAAEHLRIMDEDLYVYNDKNSLSQFALNNDKVNDLTREIYSWTPYKPVSDYRKKPAKDEEKKVATIVLLTGDIKKDMQKCANINSYYKLRDCIMCFYPVGTYSVDDINVLKYQFPHFTFFEDSATENSNWMEKIDVLYDYVVVARKDSSLDLADVNKAITWLEKTQADAYLFAPLLKQDEQDKRIIPLGDAVYACQPVFVQDIILSDAHEVGVYKKDLLTSYMNEQTDGTSVSDHLKNIHLYNLHERSVKLFSGNIG